MGIFIPFFWLFNQIDASRLAALYNLSLEGLSTAALPEDSHSPPLGGSYVGSAALLVVGLIALSKTLFYFSLEWVESWWPVAPIALGAYLIYRAREDHNNKTVELP